MADNLLNTLLTKLGMQVPESGPTPTDDQRRLYEEMAIREQAKRGPMSQAVSGVLAGAPQFARGFTISDPNMPLGDLQKTSPWEKAGMFAAAAPIFPQKGIKGLWSRAERIAESLPEKISGGKLASILKGNASKEEIGWRGLDKVVADPSKQIAKQDMISTLQKNPLDVKVTEKGGFSKGFAPTAIEDPHAAQRTTYDNYVMPGAKNYRETLIQLVSRKPEERLADAFAGTKHGDPNITFNSHHWPDDPNTLVHMRHNERVLPENVKLTPQELDKFMQGDYPGAPRYGRMLENVQSDWQQRGAQGGFTNNANSRNVATAALEHPAFQEAGGNLHLRMEEIIDQLGIHIPHAGPPDRDDVTWLANQINERFLQTGDQSLQKLSDSLHTLSSEYDQVLDEFERMYGAAVPDMPFKGMSDPPTLALKQQLLDVADRPDLDWLGIAPSSELNARGENISPEFQDVMLPRILEKLLGPYGGKVEKADLGIKPNVGDPISVLPESTYRLGGSMDSAAADLGSKGGFIQANNVSGAGGMEPIMSFLKYPDNVDEINDLKNQIINQRPNIQAFIARLSPEMKEKIRTGGFPMLMALLAQRQLAQPQGQEP